MKTSKLVRWPVVGLALAWAVACATSPTGRSQLIALPDSQLDQMGIQSFDQLKKDTPIEADPSWNAYVKCIALPVAAQARADGNWEVVVFKDETPNAFALPGGKIGVHTGILKVAKSDAQLAAVLGHEVGHVIARHGNERVSQQMAAQLGMALVSASGKVSDGVVGLLGAGAQVGILLPFSRTQESEADVIGLDYMSRAGFDPRESIELWKNMAAASGGKSPPQWLSTHPSNQARMDGLQAHMTESMAKYEQAKAAGRHPTCSRPAK
jgi:predicted Zn-dependent protease